MSHRRRMVFGLVGLHLGLSSLGCGDAVKGSLTCNEGSVALCYEGPPETTDVGACKGGVQTCDAAGMLGACVGQVLPELERCDGTDRDEDCDGVVNEDGEGCDCAPGSQEPCYDGPQQTEGVGLCLAGARTCDALGHFGPCVGQVLPSSEQCDPGLADEDCDGAVNESGADCVCSAEDGPVSCGYGGPAEALDVGSCHAGTQTCAPDGLGYDVCAGEVLPQCEICDSVADESCDGASDCTLATVSAWQFETPYDELALDLARTPDGGLVVVGTLGGAYPPLGLTLPGNYNPLVLKRNADGSLPWGTQLGADSDGSSAFQRAESVAVDSLGNIVVAGRFSGQMTIGNDVLDGPAYGSGNPSLDIFVAKLDENGNPLWAKQLHTIDAGMDATSQWGYPVRVAVGNDDDVWLAGAFGFTASLENGGVPFKTLGPAGGQDLLLARLDASGQWACAASAGGAADDVVRDLTLDENGLPIVVGQYDIGAAGTLVLSPAFSSETTLLGGGGTDMFIARAGSDCGFTVARGFENGDKGDRERAFSVAYSPGLIVVGGDFYPTSGVGLDLGLVAPLPGYDGNDVFVAGFDATSPALDTLWGASYGDNQGANQSQEYLSAIALDCAGNVLLTGRAVGNSSLAPGAAAAGEMYVAKVKPDSSGVPIATRVFHYVKADGTVAWASPEALLPGATGGALVAGGFTFGLDFGTVFLDSSGYAELFVGELGP